MNSLPTEAMESNSRRADCSPRLDFLSDDDYFMAVALLAEMRRTVSTKKGGACIVKGNNVVAIGNTQVIEGQDDGNFHFYEYHAEKDAIMNCTDAKVCTLYSTDYPCNECMKLIIQAGISAVVCLSEAKMEAELNASDKMFKEAEVLCRVFDKKNDLTIDFLNEIPPESTGKMERRRHKQNDLSDSEFFMGLAKLTSKRSRDPNTQVGACIVKDGKVIAVGHNQMPKGENDKYTWAREVENNKHLYVCHAELNAIVNSTDAQNCILYVTLFPCHECAKLLIKAGINKVVYLSDKYAEREETKASKKMLLANHVATQPFYKDEEPTRASIVIKFE